MNVPRTGPLPASSMPSTQASVMFSNTFFGISEKWEYDSPLRILVEWIEGARKTFSAGVSCAISCESRLISSMLEVRVLQRLFSMACRQVRETRQSSRTLRTRSLKGGAFSAPASESGLVSGGANQVESPSQPRSLCRVGKTTLSKQDLTQIF